MSIGRRKVKLQDERSWIFNRMVDAYEARPAYPEALVDALVDLAPACGRVADVGAGLGHLSLPLAERGLQVTAVEPAVAMLARLQQRGSQRGLTVRGVHGQAERLPLPNAAFDLVMVADALHFIDTERASYELARVLAPRGALALVTCEFTPTPFMTALQEIMQQAAPRRPREVSSSVTQMLVVAGVREPTQKKQYQQDVRVDGPTLERILGSISFIGPAMNVERYAAFRKRVFAIEHEPRWARTFTLYGGRRGLR